MEKNVRHEDEITTGLKNLIGCIFIYWVGITILSLIFSSCVEKGISYKITDEETIIVKNHYENDWDHVKISGKLFYEYDYVGSVNYIEEFNGKAELQIPIDEIIINQGYDPEKVDHFDIETVTRHNYKIGAKWPIFLTLCMVGWPVVLIAIGICLLLIVTFIEEKRSK